MNKKYFTEEERLKALRESNRKSAEKRRREQGIKPKKIYSSDEERKEVARFKAEQKRREKGIKPKGKKYNSKEEKIIARNNRVNEKNRKNGIKPRTVFKSEEERKQADYLRKKKWRENNREKDRKSKADYKKRNVEKVNESAKLRTRKRVENDPSYKLIKNIRKIISNGLERKNYSKKTKTYEILGCNHEEFKQHLESQWESWMDWSNYGKYKKDCFDCGWDIDHIIPISTGKTEEEIIKLSHYTNLQPLCSYTNRVIKKDKIK